jgi:uridine kinase
VRTVDSQEDREEIRPNVRLGRLRDDVQVRLPDHRVFDGPRGTPLVEFLRAAFPRGDDPLVAAIAAGELRELGQPVVNDIDAEPVFLSSSDGIRIYSRSLSFLLVVVVSELHPDVRVRIEYSVPHGGFFCRVEGRKPFSPRELSRVRVRMEELVADDLPILRERYTFDRVREIFASRGEEHKARLLEARAVDHLHLYSLNGVSDYFYGYMVPSTGVLKTFALETFSDGFILRFPRREDPTKLLPPKKFTALREVFDEYGKWLQLLGMRSVESLNSAIESGRIEQVVLVSEALHEKRIAEIAERIATQHKQGLRLVFIAGPSASGKTTFSRRLAIQLLAGGLQPYSLAMDDYFYPRATLHERYGENADFDSLDALDVERIREDLRNLIRGEPVAVPQFDFRTGDRSGDLRVQLAANQILLVEGIHALNPNLLVEDPERNCFRIFVSALTQLNLDIHNRVSTTDERLIRRTVRDAAYRGYSAEQTLGMWENVRAGEKRNIFPYQEEADVMFNSALGYELAVLKPLVEPLLLQVRDPRYRIEAERLLALLWWFDPYEAKSIPSNSILREFVGGSSLREFSPGPFNAGFDAGR